MSTYKDMSTYKGNDIIACEGSCFENQIQALKLIENLAYILGIRYGILNEKLLENKLYTAVLDDVYEKIEAKTSHSIHCMTLLYPDYLEYLAKNQPELFAKYGDPSKVIVSEVHPFVTCVEEKANDAGSAIKQSIKENQDWNIELLDHSFNMTNIAVDQINYCYNKHRDYFGEQENTAAQEEIPIILVIGKNDSMPDQDVPIYS